MAYLQIKESRNSVMRVQFLGTLFSFLTVLTSASTSYSRLYPLREPQSETWSTPSLAQKGSLGYDENTFVTPESLKPEVDFWIKIYTHYSTQQGVFHYSGNTEQVLGEIDLSPVYAHANWSLIRKEKEAELIVRRQKRLIAQKFKINDIKKIRLQMGLKDRMQDAIRISGLYLPMMEKIFKDKNLPLELTRVVFVESSFNIHAGSKVGASGLWQIMPVVSKKYNYISESQDLRNHPVYATQLAARIFKENYQILKSWPLAITAYNHGVGSLRKLTKKYHSNNISFLIGNVSAKKSFGFASRSFYATYLAALYVEKNANLYFPEPVYKESEMQISYFKLTKKIPFEKLLALFDGDQKKLKGFNPHIKSVYLKFGQIIPAQVIVNVPKAAPARLAESKEISF